MKFFGVFRLNQTVSSSGENDITKDDIRWYRNLEKRIAKEQRRLSRMRYGSANYWGTALLITGSRNTKSGSFMRKQVQGGMTSCISSPGKSPTHLMPS